MPPSAPTVTPVPIAPISTDRPSAPASSSFSAKTTSATFTIPTLSTASAEIAISRNTEGTAASWRSPVHVALVTLSLVPSPGRRATPPMSSAETTNETALSAITDAGEVTLSSAAATRGPTSIPPSSTAPNSETALGRRRSS